MDLKENALALLSTTAITDMSNAAIQNIYTVPVGKSCILHSALLEADGDVGANAVFTIGEGAAATDFVGTTNGDNLDADNDVIIIAPVPSATPATMKKYSAGDVLSLDIATAGNAVTGTLYLFGILY